MNNPRSRTLEFRQAYDSAKARAAPAHNKARQPKAQGSKSEVARLAGGIARDIQSTTEKLQKLAQLAKRKTLFDDRPVEISELTYIIKQDISDLNTQIGQLQQITKSGSDGKSGGGKKKEAKQVEEHNSNVVVLLQSKLAEMGIGFKDVLEIRTQNMKASKDRTEQFMYTSTSGSNLPPSNQSILNAPPPNRAQSTSPFAPHGGQQGAMSRTSLDGGGYAVDQKGKGRGDYLALNLEDAEGGRGAGGAQVMQMQMMEEQDNYIQSRSTAIETIESTIAELGSIFGQLAHMVAQQGETVQRIDADVHDISTNVQGAKSELLKYYASVSSNRWLMLKIFGVMIIFFLLFILVT